MSVTARARGTGGVGYQEVEIATAGTSVIISGVTSIPLMFDATALGTAAADSGLVYSPTESTKSAVGIVTCVFYSNVDGQTWRIIPIEGPTALS